MTLTECSSRALHSSFEPVACGKAFWRIAKINPTEVTEENSSLAAHVVWWWPIYGDDLAKEWGHDMGYDDDKKQDDQEFDEKREDDRKWKKKRDDFVTGATHQLRDNIEALAVLHGVNYESIVRNLADDLPESSLTGENAVMFVDVFKMLSPERSTSLHDVLVTIEVDPFVHKDDKAIMAKRWIAAMLEKEIADTAPYAKEKIGRLRRLYSTYFSEANRAQDARDEEIKRRMKDAQFEEIKRRIMKKRRG